MQGVMRMFGGYSPVENVIETLATAPTQLLPTLGSQLGQIKDPYKRDIDYSNPLKLLQTSVTKKLPGIRESLPTTLNMFGEPIKEQSGETGINKAFLAMFSPSLVSKETEDPTLKETFRLFNEVKDTDVIPSYSPSALTSKEDIRNFRLIYGPLAKNLLSNLYSSTEYQSATDEAKAKLVSKQLNKLKQDSKDAYNTKYKTDLR
jgi:hypothetical protein